jgi:hypothetical protein
MTDKEKLIALLGEWGVQYDVTFDGTQWVVTCPQGAHKVNGYTGFETQFTFSDAGTFVEMGAYE